MSHFQIHEVQNLQTTILSVCPIYTELSKDIGTPSSGVFLSVVMKEIAFCFSRKMKWSWESLKSLKINLLQHSQFFVFV